MICLIRTPRFKFNSLSQLYMNLLFFCLNRGGVSATARTVDWRTVNRTGGRSHNCGDGVCI